jgi:hypothetical protein
MTKYTITNEGHDSIYAIQGFIINGSYYSLSSNENKLDISCRYTASGEGLWYITISTSKVTNSLPLCIQPSVNVLDRAKDFLERYQEWTGNSSLEEVINMLNTVDVTENTTITLGNWKLTVTSGTYFTSFYWQYTFNQTDYRGLGITFLGKYVFFRDDRNLPIVSQSAPEPFGSSQSLYLVFIDYPERDSINVPRTTDIILETARPAGIIEVYLNHEAKIANVTLESVPPAGGKYTFHLAEPLQPNTTYTATVIYGQAIPPDLDSSPINIESWSFTTGNTVTTASPTIWVVAITVLVVVVGAGLLFYLRKRNH